MVPFIHIDQTKELYNQTETCVIGRNTTATSSAHYMSDVFTSVPVAFYILTGHQHFLCRHAFTGHVSSHLLMLHTEQNYNKHTLTTTPDVLCNHGRAQTRRLRMIARHYHPNTLVDHFQVTYLIVLLLSVFIYGLKTSRKHLSN